jgi:hypothetical protein
MKIERDKIIIDLSNYSKEDIQIFAMGWRYNINRIYERTREFFDHEYTNADQLIRNHKYCTQIEVFQRTIKDFMNKENRIVLDAINELAKLGS